MSELSAWERARQPKGVSECDACEGRGYATKSLACLDLCKVCLGRGLVLDCPEPSEIDAAGRTIRR